MVENETTSAGADEAVDPTLPVEPEAGSEATPESTPEGGEGEPSAA